MKNIRFICYIILSMLAGGYVAKAQTTRNAPEVEQVLLPILSSSTTMDSIMPMELLPLMVLRPWSLPIWNIGKFREEVNDTWLCIKKMFMVRLGSGPLKSTR